MFKFFSKHRRVIITTLLVVVFLISPIGANAQDSACDFWSWTTLWSMGINVGLCQFTKYLLLTVMSAVAFFLWLSGVFLDFVLKDTITDLKVNLGTLEQNGLKSVWGTIRDLMNMTFIFVLLYTAIGTILGIAKSDWKKVVSLVIIAAILINFSLFFTKVLIDASNIVAITFYDLIRDPSAGGGLSNLVMNKLKLTSFFKVGSGSILEDNGLIQMMALGLGASIFMAIAAFSFVAAAIMFVFRYIIFIFLLILSPVAVMGGILPQLGEWSKKWWDKLFSQLIWAPVYMIMVWVVFATVNVTLGESTITSGFADLYGTGDFDSRSAKLPKALEIVFNFMLLIGMMMGALIIAQSIGKSGAKFANAAAGGAMFGTAGWAGRRTIGAAGRAIAQSRMLNRLASRPGP